MKDDEVKTALERLMDHRNEQSHLRGPHLDSEYQTALTGIFPDIQTLYQACDFVTRYPLRHVTDVQYNARLHTSQYEYRDLVGDNPLVPVRRSVIKGPVPLQKGGLYFATSTYDLFLAHPWLTRMECPECRAVETYTFDRLSVSPIQILLKSLERGHEHNANDLQADFESVGLLPSASSSVTIPVNSN
jgi:hypothetical protein